MGPRSYSQEWPGHRPGGPGWSTAATASEPALSALWVTQPTPGGVESPARLCPLVCRPPFPPGRWAPPQPRLASPPAPEVDELEGQRAGQQQVGQCLPGPGLAEAGPGPGVTPVRLPQGCKRSGSVPTGPSPPCSPQGVPTPPTERGTDQPWEPAGARPSAGAHHRPRNGQVLPC